MALNVVPTGSPRVIPTIGGGKPPYSVPSTFRVASSEPDPASTPDENSGVSLTVGYAEALATQSSIPNATARTVLANAFRLTSTASSLGKRYQAAQGVHFAVHRCAERITSRGPCVQCGFVAHRIAHCLTAMPAVASTAPARPRPPNAAAAPRGTPLEAIHREPGPGRYLPCALAVTTLLVVGPVVLARIAFPGDGLHNGLVAAVTVIACSLVLSAAAAATWKRLPGSRDAVFSELMLWSWLRRYVADRRSRRQRFGISPAQERRRELAELVRLSRLMQANDPYLDGHSERVARHAVRIARGLSLPADEVRRIRTAAELHDVGKLETPREILHNPNRLSDEEYAVIKQHASRGAEMLDGITDPRIVAMVRHHHERMDGSGYPDGRAGDDIPLGARIIAVADTYDAITSVRPYRRAAPHKRAIDVLGTESGKQLDAAVVTAFLAGYAGRRQLAAWSFVGVSIERAAYALKGLLASPALPILGASAVLATSPLLTHPAGRRIARGLAASPRSSQRMDASEVSHLAGGDLSVGLRTGSTHRARPVTAPRRPDRLHTPPPYEHRGESRRRRGCHRAKVKAGPRRLRSRVRAPPNRRPRAGRKASRRSRPFPGPRARG